MYSCNNKIGVEPFKSVYVELEHKQGFTMAKQKVQLTKLKVVIGDVDTLRAPSKDNGHYVPGDIVYVLGELQVHKWAKEVYEVDGKKFILMPTEFVLLCDQSDRGV